MHFRAVYCMEYEESSLAQVLDMSTVFGKEASAYVLENSLRYR